MKELLRKSKRAEKTADPASEQNTVQNDDAENVSRHAFARGGKSVLQRAQGARTRSAGAGIAIQSRCAHGFQGVLVDLTREKALDIGVCQQGCIELNESSFGGDER